MYIITNREMDYSRDGLNAFGEKPHREGAQEISLVEVKEAGNDQWKVKPVRDKLTPVAVKELKNNYGASCKSLQTC